MPSAMIFAARASNGLASRSVARAALPALTLGSRPARPQLGHRICRSPIARLSQSSGFHSSAASSSSSVSTSAASSATTTSWTDSILSTFDPLIPYVHSLPEYLHLSGSPHGYALSIVILTFFLRSTITLPFQLWARKRQARLQEEVMPRWNVLKGKDGLPLVKMKEARRQGKPFEVYKKELEDELRSRLRSLIKEHRAEQWKTILLPISVSLPLFIATTITLRQGCLPPSPILSEMLPWSMTPQLDESLARSFEASAQMLRDRGMDPEALARLSQMPSGPTLGDKDSTVLGPIAVGMLSMLNAEVAARGRGRAMEEAKTRRQEKEEQQKGKQEGDDLEAVTGKVERAELVNQAISTGMRGFSILFIPISLNAPGALLIYWLSSITYSIGYNVITSFLSARKRKLRLTGPAQEEEARRVARIEEEVRARLAEEEQMSRREMLARKGVTVDLASASAASAPAADANATVSGSSDASAGPSRPRPTSSPSTFSNVAPNPSATFTFPQAAERPPKTARRKPRR